MGAASTSFSRRLQSLARPLRRTPLHPQWLGTRSGAELGEWLAQARGRVLDIGSASQWPRALLPDGCEYLALDHPAGAAEYGHRPAVYADAQVLPVADASVDWVLLLDVLEHLPSPERALDEIFRVLRPGGRLVIAVPFMYPLHDLPHDYHRWTEAGLRALARRKGFDVEAVVPRTQAVASAAMLFNLALADSALLALRERRPGAVLLPLVPPLVLLANLSGWLLSGLLGANPRMPHAYLTCWSRPRA